MASTDVILDRTIKNGSIVLCPLNSVGYNDRKNNLTRNTYSLLQPSALDIEAKYTDRFDDKAYYFTPDVIDGNP